MLNHVSTFSFLLLSLLAIISIALWTHTVYLLSLPDLMPEDFLNHIRNLLHKKKYDMALHRCKKENSLIAHMLAKGIESRKKGDAYIIEAIQSEEKRHEDLFWKRTRSLETLSKVILAVAITTTIIPLLFNIEEFSPPISEMLWYCILSFIFGVLVAGMSWILSQNLKNRVHYLLNTILTETLTVVKSIKFE